MGLPVLAIGSDRAWLARLERMLALRGELHWRGNWTPADARDGRCGDAALWLVDGDDPVATRSRGPIRGAGPIRLNFYRHPNLATLRYCAQSGAHGCLDKQAAPDVVRRAIRGVGIGLFAVDPSLLRNALTPIAAAPRAVVAASPPQLASARWPQLTARQREVAHCAAQGMSNKQIGRHFAISPETVKAHLHQAFEREGVSSRGALLAHPPGPGHGGLPRTLSEPQPRQRLQL